MVVHAGNSFDYWQLQHKKPFLLEATITSFFGSNVSAIQVIIRDSVSLI